MDRTFKERALLGLPTMFGALLFGAVAFADPPVTTQEVDCNWGLLTMEQQVEQGFDTGGHSSDPSGDGHGPGTNDEPRAGLANVVDKGNLNATCELIEELLH